jgi:hypothetical protein
VTHQPLARVRDLCLAVGGGAPDPSDVARLLRATPELRKFTGKRLHGGLNEWLNDPAFAELIHPRLRSIDVGLASNAEPVPIDCAGRLRRVHFPRLQQLIVNSLQQLMPD